MAVLGCFWKCEAGVVYLGTRIKEFSDNSFLEYDRGSFDKWCIYLKRPDKVKWAPRDVEYFIQLKFFAEKYGVKKVYSVYKAVNGKVDKSILDRITFLSRTYGEEDQLGVLMLLLEGMSAENASNFMNGMNWREIDALCKERGF